MLNQQIVSAASACLPSSRGAILPSAVTTQLPVKEPGTLVRPRAEWDGVITGRPRHEVIPSMALPGGRPVAADPRNIGSMQQSYPHMTPFAAQASQLSGDLKGPHPAGEPV